MKFDLRLFSCITMLAFALSVTLSANVQARIKKGVSKTFEVSPGGELDIDTDLGSIEIKTGSGNAVEIEVMLKADTRDKDQAEEIFERFDVEFEQDGNDVYVTGEYYKGKESGWRFWKRNNNKLRVGFRVTVPDKFNVTIKTSAGSISVADLDGKVNARTSGGSMEFDNINGPVDAHTSGGSISLSSCVGSADIRTSGGSITIGKVEGDVNARTSGGSISVDEVMGAIDASTSGGSVNAKITRQPKHDCRLVTSGGAVTVYIDPELNFDLDASTSSGRVSSDFPVTVRGRHAKSSMRAEINDGGPELYLRTSGGNINLYEL